LSCRRCLERSNFQSPNNRRWVDFHATSGSPLQLPVTVRTETDSNPILFLAGLRAAEVLGCALAGTGFVAPGFRLHADGLPRFILDGYYLAGTNWPHFVHGNSAQQAS